MLLAAVWAFFFLPETKGLTLDQMDVILCVLPLFLLAAVLLFPWFETLANELSVLQWLYRRAGRRRRGCYKDVEG